MIGNTNARIKKGGSGGNEVQLYDKRLISQPNAPSGWLYMCSDAYRSFSSNDLPTLYNDIMTKYTIASQGSTYTDTYEISDRMSNNPGYLVNESKIVQSLSAEDIEDFADVSSMSKLARCFTLYWNVIGSYNENYDLYYYEGYGVWNSISDRYSDFPPIYTVVPSYDGTTMLCVDYDSGIYQLFSSRYVKHASSSSITSTSDITGTDLIKKEYNNRMYFTNHGGDDDIYAISNNSDVCDLFETYSFNRKVCDFVYVDNYWYLLVNYNDKVMIYKGTDLSNSNLTDTSKWQMICENSQIYASNGNDYFSPRIFYSKDRFVVCGENSGEYHYQNYLSYFYTDDDFSTISNVIETNFSTGYWNTYFTNDCLICGNHFCYLFKLNSINNWVTLTIPQNMNLIDVSEPVFIEEFDMPTWTSIPYSAVYFTLYNNNDEKYYIYSIHIPQPISSMTSIDIQYKKYETFKFCTYSNLNNLNSIYNIYGVSNYWNIYNNLVSIPVDKQEYSIMYVSDNYQDNLYNNQ